MTMCKTAIYALVFASLVWTHPNGHKLYGGETPSTTTCACSMCAELERRVTALEKAEAERKRRREEFQRRAKPERRPERAIDQIREKVRRHAVRPKKGVNLNGKAVGK